MKATIQHTGIVTHITEQSVTVQILQESACSGCHVRSLCKTADSKEKTIEVVGNYSNLSIGQHVSIVGSLSQSRTAVVVAYVIPLLLMLAALFAGTSLGGETAGALAAFGVLAIYCVMLYLMRSRIGRRFSFRINNLN